MIKGFLIPVEDAGKGTVEISLIQGVGFRRNAKKGFEHEI